LAQLTPIDAPCAWYGDDIGASQRWVRTITAAHIEEIEAALSFVESQNIEWSKITSKDFKVPGWADLIIDLQHELESGLGITKLKGFPVERYSEEQLQKIYFGLGQNIGRPVYQNRRGELMRFIRDEGANVGAQYGQISGDHTDDGKPFLSSYARTLNNGGLRFHTDRTDVVGLLCVRQAAKGGVSRICSSVAVMNEMIRRRPDLAQVLFEPVRRSRLGEESDAADDTYDLPVFGIRDGQFTSHFSLTYIEAAQTVKGAPALTDAQSEALKLLLDLADELAFDMVFEPGDIQFLNSHVTYHSRTPFEDDKTSGQDRLLMRIWFSMPGSRPLPHDHRVLWRNVDAGALRGGIGQTPTG